MQPSPDQTETTQKTYDGIFPQLEELTTFSGKKFQFKYTSEKSGNSSDFTVRSIKFKDPSDADEKLVFGLWQTGDNPVGILFTTPHESKYGKGQCYAGSRTSFSSLRQYSDVEPSIKNIPQIFNTLDAISPFPYYAFEIAEVWRDGVLSQVFLGVVLDILHASGYRFLNLQSDKTLKDDGKAMYTRYAKGDSYNANTSVETTLTPEHQAILKKYIIENNTPSRPTNE